MNDGYTIAISGATGLVGSALAEAYKQDGVAIRSLVRRPARGLDEIYWDPAKEEIDTASLEGVDAVVHLAGKNIATEKWTPAVKKQIVDSRVVGTRILSEALASLQNKPRVLVSASAIGFYGDRPGEVCDEESPVGTGFLPETCQQWEQATQPAWEAGMRVVQLRIGVVLSTEGGMLAKLLPQFRMGLGGPVASGKQMLSWIALGDLIRTIRYVVDNDSIHGAINATAPTPVSNRDFAKALGKKLSRPTILPAPAFAIKAMMGEMGEALVLEGADIRPKRLLESGFEFEAPELATALDQLVR